VSDPLDCGFDVDGRWFRYRAAAIILDADKVLMARNEVEPYYYSIGGGVHHGETAQEAVRREVREETGAELEIQRLAFVHENFFHGDSTASLAGRSCHELTFYFLMKAQPGIVLDGISTVLDGVPEWLEWVPLDEFGRDRPAYPSFFATELPALGVEPKWIITRS
jgi:ADP-ribose pyrophosphatase YjhB (NUDIX family)